MISGYNVRLSIGTPAICYADLTSIPLLDEGYWEFRTLCRWLSSDLSWAAFIATEEWVDIQ